MGEVSQCLKALEIESIRNQLAAFRDTCSADCWGCADLETMLVELTSAHDCTEQSCAPEERRA